MKIMHRNPPTHIYGQKLANIFHRGDIAKFEVILEYGGIYLDYDVIVVNSLNPLRRYDATLGKCSFRFCNFREVFRCKPCFNYVA